MKTTPELPPMAPNMGILNYPMFEPITEILDSIKRFNNMKTTPENPAAPPELCPYCGAQSLLRPIGVRALVVSFTCCSNWYKGESDAGENPYIIRDNICREAENAKLRRKAAMADRIFTAADAYLAWHGISFESMPAGTEQPYLSEPARAFCAAMAEWKEGTK